MRLMVLTLILFLACSQEQPPSENMKQFYLRYTFIHKVFNDSAKADSIVQPYYERYQVSEKDLVRFQEKLDSDFPYRSRFFKSLQSDLDSLYTVDSLLMVFQQANKK